jgi:uncharacterized protein
MNNIISTMDLPKIAVGLNIEGCRPTKHLPRDCKWYNIVQAIDEPLKGDTFDMVMRRVRDNNYSLIEEAVGINIDTFIEQLCVFVRNVASHHKKVLIHIHQYTGTTKLAEILTKRTAIETILDKTNYYESPVIYSEKYPNIDALISISQCAGIRESLTCGAGLGIRAGQWIIPDSFMKFDVHNNIIYTTPELYSNDAHKFFPFEHVRGNILVVDDLWNPDISKPDNILLLDKLDSMVLEFVIDATKIFDDSHNWQHAVNVAKNALLIRDSKATLYLALLHDVCDHKYSNAIARSVLSDFIKTTLPDYQEIDDLIDKVSFSYNKLHLDEPSNADLDAVRDADRLEALGTFGIRRCETLVQIRGGKLPDDVIIHSYDKLLRLLPEKFIVTPLGRELARPLHNIIVDYVRENLPKTTLTYEVAEYQYI